MRIAFILALSMTVSLPSVSDASYQPSAASKLCLGCHGKQDLKVTFSGGEQITGFVDTNALGESIHRDLECTECHSGIEPNHKRRELGSRRALAAMAVESCGGCHSPGEGLHGKLLTGMDELMCSDCHGAHDIKPIGEDVACMACHKYKIPISFTDGTTEKVAVHPEGLSSSVHSDLDCGDCHPGFSKSEHPIGGHASRRAMTLALSQACRECHSDKHASTQESIHNKMLELGNTDTPVCVHCHGSHEIASGHREKLLSARRCKTCHREIYGTYAKSVHGKAMLNDENQDVPVCSDCHEAHRIMDPKEPGFAYRTPRTCGNCHAKEALMAKYGLSTAVLSSYLEDFHGVTASYYEKQTRTKRRIAVCTDCHGIHDIESTKGPSSGVVKEKLLSKCQSCHPDATETFPDAWISHYEPTWERASLVYLVNLGYKIFIPFMIAGLMLQVLLHLWRYAVKR